MNIKQKIREWLEITPKTVIDISPIVTAEHSLLKEQIHQLQENQADIRQFIAALNKRIDEGSKSPIDQRMKEFRYSLNLLTSFANELQRDIGK